MDIYKRRTYRKKKGGMNDEEITRLYGEDFLDYLKQNYPEQYQRLDSDSLNDIRNSLTSDDGDDNMSVIPESDASKDIVSSSRFLYENGEVDDTREVDETRKVDSDKLVTETTESENEALGGFYRNAKKGGTNVLKNAFDDFLREKASLSGGADEDTEVREGYDSFTIVEASSGNPGGRFISKTPYTAAYKAASRLFKDTKSNSLTFVMQKTTKGSNKRYYAYQATVKYLSKPMLVFKNDEEGNKIVMNTHGQVLRVNKNKKVVNSTGSVKKDYNPNEKISSLTSFNYKPYLIKEVTKDITIKAIEVPSELKEKQMEKAKNKMTDEQKEMMKQKKADKKAREAAKKAAEKEKERARKEKERERARRQKEKEKEQARKEKLRNKKMMLKGGNGMCSLNGCM